MAHGYSLVILPKEATFRPTPQQMSEMIKFLAERLEIGGDWSVSGEDELSNESAIDHLRAACASSGGGTEAIVSFQDLLSGSLFGYEIDSPDPDENYWADELRIYLTGIPFPWCDWEYEEAAGDQNGSERAGRAFAAFHLGPLLGQRLLELEGRDPSELERCFADQGIPAHSGTARCIRHSILALRPLAAEGWYSPGGAGST